VAEGGPVPGTGLAFGRKKKDPLGGGMTVEKRGRAKLPYRKYKTQCVPGKAGKSKVGAFEH